jgi:hypothetical protein
MDEVTIGGIKYLPASKLAKEYRYTSDYIGQLCRSKKIDAQLVGRSWYVNPESLLNHKKSRYSSKPALSTKTKKDEVVEEVKIRIEPVLKKTTVRSIQNTSLNALPKNNFAKRIDWKPLRYEIDESDLLPPLKREIEPVSLKVDLADSSDISIKSSVKTTILVPDELPVVSLKGTIKITSLDEYFGETETQTNPVSGVAPNLADVPKAESRQVVKRIPKIKSAQPAVVFSDFSRDEVTDTEVVGGWSSVVFYITIGLFIFFLIGSLTVEHWIDATSNSYAAGIGFSVEEYQTLLDRF